MSALKHAIPKIPQPLLQPLPTTRWKEEAVIVSGDCGVRRAARTDRWNASAGHGAARDMADQTKGVLSSSTLTQQTICHLR